MRRPQFKRWIRRQILEIASIDSFSLRSLAALAQHPAAGNLPAALLLYAHEDGCVDKLISYTYDETLREEYVAVEQHLGTRSAERLALRGTPMRSLPKCYQAFLEEFERAYHAPERTTNEKKELQRETVDSMLRSGLSPSSLAHALDLDAANVHALLTRGETQRFTLETLRRIAEYARTHDNALWEAL